MKGDDTGKRALYSPQNGWGSGRGYISTASREAALGSWGLGPQETQQLESSNCVTK